MNRLEGKKAIVTGGAGGIGTAICKRFVAEGAEVISLDIAQALVDDWLALKVDITRPDDLQNIFDKIATRWDGVDVVVNAAGIEIEKTIEETSLEEWNKIFSINVTGTFLVSKLSLPLLRKSGKGNIINFGSYDGFIADPKLAAYCATKGAVHALTKAMACDHGPEGIRVNAICPGFVQTPMLESFVGESGSIEELKNDIQKLHPTHTIGQPEDIASLVLWLASDEARYASGQLWVIDGGLTAQVQQMNL